METTESSIKDLRDNIGKMNGDFLPNADMFNARQSLFCKNTDVLEGENNDNRKHTTISDHSKMPRMWKQSYNKRL
jgi:hypothetical protein